ncbi:molybdate ABC transporter substrate-binding protein [Polaromonas sp. LjRoot131]|uniref:molybdate ABC transporter substrate-binding protein n=1 Tax=Polaromonas sp. LjRoot131 TaxID=3342262 RepID=UPI003ECFE49A
MAHPSPSILHLLSGGAAQGLVTQLQDRFRSQHHFEIAGTFGAVGLMKDGLLAGKPCDVIILSQALISQLAESGHVQAASERPLGAVKTGVAVKTGEPAVDVGSAAALKAALQAACGLYFPDPMKATAGIHFMRVLRELGLDAELAGRLRPYPNGAAAMKAMADCNEPGLLGCTQVTEILFTPGVELVAALPKAFELATVYTAAVCTASQNAQAAGELIAMLASPGNAATRRACGFEA